MEFFGYLLVVFLIYGEAQFLIRFIKFPSHLALLGAMLANTLLLYVFAMVDILPAGLFVVIILALLMTVAAVIKARFSNSGKWFTLSLVTFLTISFVIFLYTRGTMFYVWDEFSHWGVIYRYLMTMQALPTNRDVVMVTYPPFSPLWQYFVSKILGFSEANAYFGHILLQFTCITALFPDEKWANAKKYFLSLLGGILAVFVLGFLFQSLYVDLLMALLLAVAFSQINIDGTNTFVNFLMVMMSALALALTKPTGIALTLIAISVYIASIIRFRDFTKEPRQSIWQNRWLINGVQAVALFGAIFLVWSGWGNFTKNIDYNKVVLDKQSTPVSLEESFPVKPEEYLLKLREKEIELRISATVLMQPIINHVRLDGLFRSFTPQAPYRTKLIVKNFVAAFSNEKIGSSKVTLKSFLVGILLLVGVNILITLKVKSQLKGQYLLVNGLFFIGFLVYAVSLFFSYVVIFLPIDGISAPSLSRYLGTYLLAWGLFNLVITYRISILPKGHWSQQFSFLIVGGFAAGCLFFLPSQQFLHLPPSPYAEQFEAEKVYEKISQVKFTPQDKLYEVYSVMPSNYGFKHYVLRYLLAPTGSNNEGWSIGKKENENDVYTIDFSPEEWFGILRSQNYTFVLITISDQDFWDQYGGLFDQYSTDFSQPQLYKVEADGLHSVPLN